ncbi:MAG: hypothetical protein A2064_01420 [Spirochaetes bacterium GWB1_66_5]|nr:MAG: hypothetical protein A2064_01420 [Spirochaetes bacterium GWB1_66_5]
MLAASRIVVGGIGVMGNLFLVSLRLLNVETGEAEVGLSEKYPSLEALAGDGERLAAALAGGSPGAQAASYRPLTAQSLISSAKAQELSARLARLRRRVRPAEYEDWLKRKGFAGYEGDAAVEEKLVFLEEYLDQRNTHGHSLELAATCLLPGVFTELDGSWTNTTTVSALFGVSLGWSYQLSNRLSVGAYLANAWGASSYLQDDGMVQLSNDYAGVLVCGGPTVCLGNKVEGFAVLFSTGAGGIVGASEFALPLRSVLFFRNFFLGYTAQIGLFTGWMHHQLEAGYSIFLGRLSSWPPRP